MKEYISSYAQLIDGLEDDCILHLNSFINTQAVILNIIVSRITGICSDEDNTRRKLALKMYSKVVFN